MASVHYPVAITSIGIGTIDLDTTQIVCILAMTNTVADTETTVDNFAGWTGGEVVGLDEFDGSGYTPGWGSASRKVLANVTVTDDGTTMKFDNTADLTWSSLGAGTRSITGVVIAKEGGANDTTSIPICFLEVTDTAANGGDITIAFNASGILTIA